MKKYTIIAIVLLLGIAVVCLKNSFTTMPRDVRATRIVVEKHLHLMTVYTNDKTLRTYHIALGRGDSAAKQREGDNRTPEGHYFIDSKNERSQFHKALHISYPSLQDVLRAKSQGVSPGGAVMIHGLRNNLRWLGPLHRLVDWTQGCVAVTDAEIDEIWTVVPVGTPVQINH